MFTQARIKLTIWYILISMLVSMFFSLVIFSILHQGLSVNEQRMELRLQRIHDIDPFFVPNFEPHRKDLEETENNIKRNLLYINLVIFGISSLAGYFLSGRTLLPIQEMVTKQNQFIADASHELRTPLTALKTGIEVNLRDKKMNIKQARAVLEENLVDVNKLKLLSENLLTLVTLQKHSIPHFQKILLKDVLESAIRKVTYLAKEKNITIKSNFSSLELSADKERLIDLFVILLDNAIKYSPKDTEISISSALDSVAQVIVADQGIGIEKKDLQHIFERFYRVDKSRSKMETNGYGLGLAIAKEVVDLHKGTISVLSEVEKGTKFIVRIPIK